MPRAGIYKITNQASGKVYIGQSLDIKGRIRRHRYQLKKGAHPNGHLSNSHAKHGGSCLIYETLFVITDSSLTKSEIVEILNYHEKAFILKYNAYGSLGYNLTTGGDNKTFSPSSIQKMRDAHKGQIPSLLCRLKTSQRMRGRVVSEETKLKLSMSIKGVWATREDRTIKRKKGYKVGPASEERKRKIGDAQRGNKNHNFGKPTPEHVKQKCRDSYHGSQCHLAKLDDQKVRAIKLALAEGQCGSALARKYGVAAAQISSIKTGKTWKHVI